MKLKNIETLFGVIILLQYLVFISACFKYHSQIKLLESQIEFVNKKAQNAEEELKHCENARNLLIDYIHGKTNN